MSGCLVNGHKAHKYHITIPHLVTHSNHKGYEVVTKVTGMKLHCVVATSMNCSPLV